MKTLTTSTHNCTRTHRTVHTLAECIWPDAAMITGDGSVALLAHCGMLSVQLFSSIEDAKRRKQWIDERSCGRGCGGEHEIVILLDD